MKNWSLEIISDRALLGKSLSVIDRALQEEGGEIGGGEKYYEKEFGVYIKE